MKKYVFIVVILLAISFFVIFKFENNQTENIYENSKEMEVITEDVENISEIEVKQEEPEKQEQQQQEEPEKTTTETKSVISQKEEPKSEVVNSPKKEEQKENKSENHEIEQSKVEENKDNFKDIEVKQEEIEEKEVKQEEPEKQTDEEYERLMAQVEYATYDECMKAGFDIAFSDTVNILGFDPIEVIYKGEVLGYKLKIHYTNPMGN